MVGFQSFVVVFALWTGIAVIVLTCGLFGVILTIRLVQAARQRRAEKLIQRWRSVMTRALVEVPKTAPALRRRDAADVMSLWAYYHEFLRGDVKANLNRLAQLSGMDLHAKRALRSDSVRRRLLAIHVLGNLRDRETRALLRPIARSANPYLSLAAGHALMRINPREAVPEFVAMIAARPDWSPAKVMAILQEAGPEVVSEPLAAAALRADAAYQPLLIVFLAVADEAVALRTIRQILLATADQQVLTTCLYQLSRMAHPDGLRLVRIYLEHPNWIIQLHAVQGVGRMGGEQDADDLIRMLRHRKYWIRLRAAEALAGLPRMDPHRLSLIRDQQSDRYARDILNEVIGRRVAA